MYILDTEKFRAQIQLLGFKTINELASYLGVHRNTISGYLSESGVFKKNFEEMMSSLGLDPLEYIKKTPKQKPVSDHAIASFIDELSSEFPGLTFTLFGSRARGRHHRYSDLDIGVFSSVGIDHKEYLSVRKLSKQLEDSLPITSDIVNLNRADKVFLQNISTDIKFLTGKRTDWLDLLERIKDGTKPEAS